MILLDNVEDLVDFSESDDKSKIKKKIITSLK